MGGCRTSEQTVPQPRVWPWMGHQKVCPLVCQDGVGPWEQPLGGVRWSGSTGSLQAAGPPSAGAPSQQLPLHLQQELAAQVGPSP